MRAAPRTCVCVATVGVLAALLAMVLLGGCGDGDASTTGAGGADPQLAAVADNGTASPAPEAQQGLLDPAKQEPILDLFTAKDPFAPIGGFGPQPTPVPTPAPTPEPSPTSPTELPESADISIDDVTATVFVGDEAPPDMPVFYIVDITDYGVIFEFLDGQLFDDGSISVEVAEGQEIVVTAAETGESYRIAVLSLNYANGGGTNGGGTNGGGTNGGGTNGGDMQGHTIELLSINTQDGVHTATLKVDGTTYADKAVGDTFSTDWGQIKILGIDPAAQSVTILHGDDTIVLYVGRKVEK